MEQKFQIIRTNKGIANRFNNGVIEINEKLFDSGYENLLKEILQHEKEHSDIGWNCKDFMLDLRGFKNRQLYTSFIITTPNSWWQFLPLYKSSFGKYYWDISLLLSYGAMAIIIGLAGWTIIT